MKFSWDFYHRVIPKLTLFKEGMVSTQAILDFDATTLRTSRVQFSNSQVRTQLHSKNGYHVWKWKFYSELAATGFPFSNKNKMCNENVNPIPIKELYFRWEANHIHVYSHSEWYCYSHSFQFFQSVETPKNVLQFLTISAHNQTLLIALPKHTTSLLNTIRYMVT